MRDITFIDQILLGDGIAFKIFFWIIFALIMVVVGLAGWSGGLNARNEARRQQEIDLWDERDMEWNKQGRK